MFYEETSIAPDSNKRAVRAVILEIISTVLFAAFVFTLIYGVFAAPSFLVLSLVFIAVSFLFRLLSLRANVSFDYSVGDGRFVIGKIIGNKKRKDIFDLSAQDILRVTKIGGYLGNRKDKKTVFCTANTTEPDNKSFVLLETKEKLIVIEAGDKLSEILISKSFYC